MNCQSSHSKRPTNSTASMDWDWDCNAALYCIAMYTPALRSRGEPIRAIRFDNYPQELGHWQWKKKER